MSDNNLLKMEDLSDVFSQLKDMEEIAVEPTAEELASQRRYEEIIKKQKENSCQ